MRTASLLLLTLAPSIPALDRVGPSTGTVDAPPAAHGIEAALPPHVLDEALASLQGHGLHARMIAIADMTRPSTERRLFVVDLERNEVVLRTWVAHGRNSGDLRCTSVSDGIGSLQTSRGLFRVGAEIVSPKHGAALMLHGLDPGVNDHAERREIIVHGADYVGQDFIDVHGRLGRSFGCPAVSPEVMPRLIHLLANEGYLYIHFARS
jgi:hypothetical protein